ncbi:MAG: acyl-CoA synthetase FdrA [Anaerolineaceae bacterium]|nr:acyl-CoA synthetase FdrA [Anaerolineaceae bacterium]
MSVKTLIKTSEYHDSVSLMLVARELTEYPGVVDASVVMGTDANKSLLEQAGLLTPEADATTPNDLIIAVKADDAVAEKALEEAEKILSKKQTAGGEGAEFLAKTVRGAVRSHPEANMAIISVAGRYAAEEAWEALFQGLHVLLFSDNVSLEDEIALKKFAAEHGLLLMGPGAGTAIINGVALGFANVIPEGPVGIVSAAGTGLQEVSTLLAKNGIGITQGIGTGGRDLKESVGGIMMLAGLKALQEDENTKYIVLVGKPPAPSVTKLVMDQIAKGDKPTVMCFMGGDVTVADGVKNAMAVRTLQEGGLLGAKLAGADLPDIDQLIAKETAELKVEADKLATTLSDGQCYLRGLFSGGTLCYESQVIWEDLMSEPVLSNAPLDHAKTMKDSTRSEGHCTVDLGEEEFTVGRPHPMIDNDLRIRRIYQEAADPEVAVIIMDVVIGYGAHMDPASELGEAIQEAKAKAKAEGRELIVIASVTGTDGDPQGLQPQVRALEKYGVIVCPSNAAASRLAGMIVEQKAAKL